MASLKSVQNKTPEEKRHSSLIAAGAEGWTGHGSLGVNAEDVSMRFKVSADVNSSSGGGLWRPLLVKLIMTTAVQEEGRSG